MKVIKVILKWILYFLLLPILYVIIALILSTITIEKQSIDNRNQEKSIYLYTNGVHLDIVIPKKDIDTLLLSHLKSESTDNYLSFGWGDENFYINTPTWDDLTFRCNGQKGGYFSLNIFKWTKRRLFFYSFLGGKNVFFNFRQSN